MKNTTALVHWVFLLRQSITFKVDRERDVQTTKWVMTVSRSSEIIMQRNSENKYLCSHMPLTTYSLTLLSIHLRFQGHFCRIAAGICPVLDRVKKCIYTAISQTRNSSHLYRNSADPASASIIHPFKSKHVYLSGYLAHWKHNHVTFTSEHVPASAHNLLLSYPSIGNLP
jgi:hypothetical protein